MPDFPSLAALRQGLTSDNADDRGQAYQSVLEADVQPSAVLGSDPGEETVESLTAAGVIPEGGEETTQVAERWSEVIDLLQEIADNTAGGS